MGKLRLIAILLTLSLAFSLFAACAQPETETSTAPEGSEAPAESGDSGAEAADGMIGGSFTIFQNVGKVQSAGKPGSTETDFTAVQEYIFEQTGTQVEVIIPPKGEEEAKLNMMFAAQDEFDLFWGDWTKYAGEGAIAPLTEQIDMYGQDIVANWGDAAMQQMKDSDGTTWGIPRMAPIVVYPVYVQQDWLDATGMEVPTTIDELEAVMEAFKTEDPAGNGLTIPLITTKGEDLHKVFSAGFTGEGYGFFEDEDGMLKPTVMDDKFADYLAKMNEWYEKGYIYQEALAIDGTQAREIIKKGQVGVAAMWYSAITIQSPFIQPEATYTMAQIEGPMGTCETVNGMSASSALIPIYSENAETVVKFINWQHQDIYNHIVLENGIEGVNWQYVNEDNQEIELLNEDYIGEFVSHQGLGLETRYIFSDPIKEMHYDYIREEITNLDRAVKPDSFNLIVDNGALQDAVPNLEDIRRMIEEENTKFITGQRDLSEYDQFQEELMGVGMQDYIDELTRQYNLL